MIKWFKLLLEHIATWRAWRKIERQEKLEEREMREWNQDTKRRR